MFRDIKRKYSGMSVATIEERLRLYGSKTHCFCPQNKWTE